MSDLKLHQLLAIAKGRKATLYSMVTDLNKKAQRADLFVGFTRRYVPKDEFGEAIPPEKKVIQQQAEALLRDMQEAEAERVDLSFLVDRANQIAKADLVVDGVVLAKDVPATTFLMLEKTLTDMKTFIQNLPGQDASEEWSFDGTKDCYVTEPTEAAKTKKVTRPLVKAPATDKHPAQVDLVTEDVTVGTWHMVKMTSGLPAARIRELNTRIEKLIRATKLGREQANSVLVPQEVKIGDSILGYLFK